MVAPMIGVFASFRAGLRSRTLVPALLPFLAFSAFPVAEASAHAVFIHARPDGERICTESWFSKKSTVRGGEVRMEDARGGLLASAVTDEAGTACFPVPEGVGDLRFIVLAGQGHRAEFELPVLRENIAPEPPETFRPPDAAGNKTTYGAVPPPAGGGGPGVRDIIGGAGWLVGLAGIGAFVASRRKSG
jgi:nickel transport protein